jgi:hypothetical protein
MGLEGSAPIKKSQGIILVPEILSETEEEKEEKKEKEKKNLDESIDRKRAVHLFQAHPR